MLLQCLFSFVAKSHFSIWFFALLNPLKLLQFLAFPILFYLIKLKISPFDFLLAAFFLHNPFYSLRYFKSFFAFAFCIISPSVIKFLNFGWYVSNRFLFCDPPLFYDYIPLLFFFIFIFIDVSLNDSSNILLLKIFN